MEKLKGYNIMALKDYLGPGTYSVLENITYIKSNKCVRFVLEIYHRNIKSTNISVPPSAPIADDIYYVPLTPAATGDWAGNEGKICTWRGQGSNSWDWQFLTPGEIFCETATDNYLMIDDRGAVEIKNWAKDSITWDKWFAPEKSMFDAESNIIKQIYSFLKATQEGFENVTDT